MSGRARKFIGTILMIFLVVGYALFAMAFAVARLGEAPPVVVAGYFLVTGLLWVVPAGLLIRWMQRP